MVVIKTKKDLLFYVNFLPHCSQACTVGTSGGLKRLCLCNIARCSYLMGMNFPHDSPMSILLMPQIDCIWNEKKICNISKSHTYKQVCKHFYLFYHKLWEVFLKIIYLWKLIVKIWHSPSNKLIKSKQTVLTQTMFFCGVNLWKTNSYNLS